MSSSCLTNRRPRCIAFFCFSVFLFCLLFDLAIIGPSGVPVSSSFLQGECRGRAMWTNENYMPTFILQPKLSKLDTWRLRSIDATQAQRPSPSALHRATSDQYGLECVCVLIVVAFVQMTYGSKHPFGFGWPTTPTKNSFFELKICEDLIVSTRA